MREGAGFSLKPRVFLLLCVALLSLLEFRALDLIGERNLPAEVEATAGLVAGHPYWKAYQNRLLGPLAVTGIARLTGLPLAGVYQGVCLALLCAANALAARLFRRTGGTVWGYVIAYAGLFVAWQDPEWSYLWDYVDLVTMLLFAWAVVVSRWSLWQFAALFVVELANRESAQFIALWLVLDALRPETGGWVDAPRLGLGVGLGAVGTVWTHWVRNALCLGETGVVPRAEITEFADGQFYMGRVTLDLLRDPWPLPALTLAAGLAALGVLLWRAWPALGGRAWKVATLLAAMIAANVLLAFIYELRVWQTFLPFAVCLAYLPARHASGVVTGR